MADIKVTELEELSADKVDEFTWLLASYSSDDEQSSNKLNYASVSACMYNDLCIGEIQDTLEEVAHGHSERVNKLSADVLVISAYLSNELPLTYVDNNKLLLALSAKQNELSSGINIKTLKVNGETHSILGAGEIEISSSGGGSGEPSEYIRSAQVEKDASGNDVSLTLYKKDGLQQVTFTPKSSGSVPPGYEQLSDDVDQLNEDVSILNEQFPITSALAEDNKSRIDNIRSINICAGSSTLDKEIGPNTETTVEVELIDNTANNTTIQRVIINNSNIELVYYFINYDSNTKIIKAFIRLKNNSNEWQSVTLKIAYQFLQYAG